MAQNEDRRTVTVRLGVLQSVVALLFSALAVSFWVLQIAQHDKYAEMAENNNQRTLALRAPRGVVFDRNGAVLVENRHSFSISIVREHTTDLNRTVRLLASVLGFEERAVREIVDRHRREPTYRPIIIVQDAMTTGILGIGGLAKTVVGFLAGIIGTQFIVTQSLPRFLVFFAATLLHSLVFVGLYVLLDLRHFGTPYTAAVGQAAGNAAVGVVAFQLVELLPGAVERRRAAKSQFRR